MTKQHFIRAAEIVKSIRDGHWTDEPPAWADNLVLMSHSYTRAVQTAEAFLFLFKEYNPRFDEQRFLVACGLVEKPVKLLTGAALERRLSKGLHGKVNGSWPVKPSRGGYRCDNNPNGKDA
jgi:hypothetical protein